MIKEVGWDLNLKTLENALDAYFITQLNKEKGKLKSCSVFPKSVNESLKYSD